MGASLHHVILRSFMKRSFIVLPFWGFGVCFLACCFLWDAWLDFFSL
jgi:hypothetical protein